MPCPEELTAFFTALGECAPRVSAQYFEEIASTNTAAKQLAAEGGAEGTLLVAATQTAGRGRMGRSFYSPGNTGLYMTMLLRPRIAAQAAVQLTAATAVAVAESIEQVFGLAVDIKWVNDIYLQGRKVCGILTESAFDGHDSMAWAVVGIGVNLAPPPEGFPPQLRDTVGSLCPQGCTPARRGSLAGDIWRRFLAYYDALPNPVFLPEYRRRSIVLGRQAVLVKPGQAVEEGQPVTVTGMDDTCALLVQTTEGNPLRVESGEISLRLT